MTLQVTGKNIDAGEAFKTYIADKLKTALGKYIGEELMGHVRLEKERGRFHTQCSIRLRSGLVLEANGEGGDAYASADSAVERLETRVRRHKRRLKDHHSQKSAGPDYPETAARDYTVQIDGHDEGDRVDDHPIIIAESERSIRELPVSEAVMQLDVADKPFLVFQNAAHGGINVVYRRSDGHIGWIDPAQQAEAGSVRAAKRK